MSDSHLQRYTNSDDKGTSFVSLTLGNYSYKRYEEQSIQWESWCGCCAGEALSVLGCRSGFQVLIKTVAQNGAGTNLYDPLAGFGWE